MDRKNEIAAKHEQVRQLLHKRSAQTLWLRRTRNIAWFTAGADASIPIDSEVGAYSVMITPERRVIVTNNIEGPRLRAEEDFGALGFEFAESQWYEEQPPQMSAVITDDEVEADLQNLRVVLSAGEQVRLRALGHDAAAALEEVARAIEPGDTEWQIGARLAAACRARGGAAVVNLIATDERIQRYRHPTMTDKPLRETAMIVVCMRRGGLIVSATRIVHFGKLPDALHEKLHKVAYIDAAAMVASRPGRTLGAAFADIQAAYAAEGETTQWQFHHQGGLAGYQARERVATPGDPTLIQVGNAMAWNPSIVGCKSEDTILVGEDGFEIVSHASSSWPVVEVDYGGQIVARPGILER